MRLLFLSFGFVFLFGSTYSIGITDTIKGALGKLGLTDALINIRNELKNGRIKIHDVLNQTKGKWLELTDELFDASLKEFKIPVKDENDKTRKRNFFKQNLAKAQELTKKSTNALFGVTKFSFMELQEFRKVFVYYFYFITTII